MAINIMQIILMLSIVLNCAFAQLKIQNVDEKPENPECVCVPVYQCKDGNVITDGSGLLDSRKKIGPTPVQHVPVGTRYKPPSCGQFHVCCKAPSVGPPVKPYENQCGVRQPNGINSRILSTSNKSEAQFGEWPWQAMILKKEGQAMMYICGAVLIDEKHVLTVAHCVYAYVMSGKHSNLLVRFGEWDTRKENEFLPVQDRDVLSIHIHPKYRNSSLWNDIAVLSLKEAVIFAPNVATICLPKPKANFKDAHCVVTGWGKNAYDGGSYSNILKVVEVPVVDHDRCQSLLRKTRLGQFFDLHKSFICAGGQKGKDSCKGDGGGPLSCTHNNDGIYVIAGLVDWGIDCGQNDIPGVYVNIVHFLDWIPKITGLSLQSYWSTVN